MPCLIGLTGDLTRRMCTAAEIKFYFSSFYDNGGQKNYLRPNKNCNLTSWVSGCEPGWSCSVSENEKVNLKDSKVVPIRDVNCRACCEGFFCPHGITCMIRIITSCPLDSLTIPVGVLICGQMLELAVKSSALQDTTVQALYRKFLVVVGIVSQSYLSNFLFSSYKYSERILLFSKSIMPCNVVLLQLIPIEMLSQILLQEGLYFSNE
ncbi:hypothetical protein BHE74_00020061 [Ensete ventricosum]|nr:hypothetical protein BHE74_00020061 [Ensete ventricosum]